MQQSKPCERCSEALFVSEEEREALVEVINAWRDGLVLAEEATIEDMTITTPEVLLDLTGAYRAQDKLLRGLVDRISL